MTDHTTTNPRLEFFDSIAGQWDGWHDLEDLSRKLDVFLEKSGIDPNATVLDLGCGTGNLTLALLNGRLSPTGRIVAVDISEKMLDLARRKVTDPRVSWHCAAADQLPLQDGATDHVICFSAWPHFQDPLAVARELRRVLRDGGSLHILHLISRADVNRIHADAHPSVHHDLLVPACDTADLLAKCRFGIVTMTDDDQCYMITACKQG